MLFKLRKGIMGKGQMYTGIYQCYLRQGKMREKPKHLSKKN